MLFTLLTLTVIFCIIKLVVHSNMLAVLGTLMYITIPEILARFTAGGHSALTNLAILLVVYFYFSGKESKTESTNNYMFFSGMFAGLSDHKTVIIFASIFLNEMWLNYKVKKSLLRINDPLCLKAIMGFMAGLLVYWTYGLAVDTHFFIVDHFRNHLFERILHIDSLGYGGHHLSLSNLWVSFVKNAGWVYFVLAFFVYSYNFIKPKEENWKISFLFFWFLVGAVAFSVIDWRQTKHMLIIVAPLVLGTTLLINSQKKYRKSVLVAVVVITILYNIKILVGFIGTKDLLLISPLW